MADKKRVPVSWLHDRFRVCGCSYNGYVWYVIDELVAPSHGAYITWFDHYSTQKAAEDAVNKHMARK